MAATTIKPRVLLGGLAMVESPRWHEGRLWFPHWGTPEIVAVDLEGNGRGPSAGAPAWAIRSGGFPTGACWRPAATQPLRAGRTRSSSTPT